MANNDRGPPARSLGKQHALLRLAVAPLEEHLAAGAPAALVLLALKNLRYLSAAHEKAEHEVLHRQEDYPSLEYLHRGLGSLWGDFMTSLELALDGPGSVIGEDQVHLGQCLLRGLTEHWSQEERIFASEFQDSQAKGFIQKPGLSSPKALKRQHALSRTLSVT